MTGTRDPQGHAAPSPSGIGHDDRTELHRLCVFELDLTCGHCLTVSVNGWYPVTVVCCDRLGGTWHQGAFYPFASDIDHVRCLEERYENRPQGSEREPLRVLRCRPRTDDPTVPAHSWQRGTAGRFPKRVGGPGPRSWTAAETTRQHRSTPSATSESPRAGDGSIRRPTRRTQPLNPFDERQHAMPPSAQQTPAPIPVTINGYPVITAIREREIDHSWIVVCRRTEKRFDDQPLYMVWHVWYADGAYHAENGDYGPHHGLTFRQAHESLRRLAGWADRDPAGTRTHTTVTGDRVEIVTERRDDLLTIDVCDSWGFGCGDARLASGTLTIDLPDDWAPADKATVARLIVDAAFTPEPAR